MSEYKFDLYSNIVSVCANMLVLGAVTLSMFMASFQPETHLSAFCSWFFALLVPILGGAWLCKRILRKKFGEFGASPQAPQGDIESGGPLTPVL